MFFVCGPSKWSDLFIFPCGNVRMKTVAADMRLCRRRRRTWLCSGGERSSSFTCDQISMGWVKTINSLCIAPCSVLHLVVSAATSWTSCWKLREPTWRSFSAYYRCFYNPPMGSCLVSVLTCVRNTLFFGCHYRDTLPRWITLQCFPLFLRVCKTKRRFSLATWQKFTTFIKGKRACHEGTFVKSHKMLLCLNEHPLFSRTFLRELEQYTDCPELVGRCFLERVSYSWCSPRRAAVFNNMENKTFRERLRWRTCRSMRSTVTTNLALRAFGGSVQTVPSSRSMILQISTTCINQLNVGFCLMQFYVLDSSGVSEEAGT